MNLCAPSSDAMRVRVCLLRRPTWKAGGRIQITSAGGSWKGHRSAVAIAREDHPRLCRANPVRSNLAGQQIWCPHDSRRCLRRGPAPGWEARTDVATAAASILLLESCRCRPWPWPWPWRRRRDQVFEGQIAFCTSQAAALRKAWVGMGLAWPGGALVGRRAATQLVGTSPPAPSGAGS